MKYQGKITDPKDLVTKEYVDTGLSGKQNALTFDDVPTAGSSNPVKSSGVKSALDKVAVRPNLLEDAYFVGGGSQQGDGQFPINQRGQTSYTGAVNGIDRWKGTNNNTVVQLNSNYLSLSSASQTANVYLQQEFSAAPGSFLGQTITVSALLDSGLYFKTGVVPSSVHASGNFRVATMDDIPSGRDFGVFLRAANSAANAGRLYYQIGLSNGGSSHRVIAVKVELGDTQTLCHNEGTEADPVWVLNEIPNFQQELAKCQRYLWIPDHSSTYAQFGLGIATSATAVTIQCYPKVTMNGIPSLTQNALKLRVGATSNITPTEITLNVNSSSRDVFTLSCAGSEFAVGSPAVLYKNTSGAYLIFSCEL